ncbi:MAG: FAD-binding oxidoreductase [Bacteroidota bacterium]
MPVSTLRKIQDIVGKKNLLDSQEDRIAYSYDATPLLQTLPDAVVRPSSVQHISSIMKLANEEKFGVIPRGSGSGLSGGSIPVENSIVLLTNQWNRILEIDEENHTTWVEPGVITAQLHIEVEKIGLLYPPDPGSMTICTLGGNVAENAGGLRGLKYGVTKNYVMGLEAVLPSGEVIHVGGKSVKDVAGYSLKDVFIGSEGTLGIFTKILLKLIPKPQSFKTMLAYYETIRDAAETVSAIVAARITPATLEFLDAMTIRCVEEYAHVGLPTDAGALLLIEVDGRRAEVEEDAQKILEFCRHHRAKEVQVAATTDEAIRLKTARRVAFSALARVKPTTILEDTTVPRSVLAPMVEKIQEIALQYDVLIGNFGHAGDGNLHPTCLTDERDRESIVRAEKAREEIFLSALEFGGTITGEHGVGLAKKKILEQVTGGPALEMMRNLKKVMDPNEVLNPGKVVSLKPRCEGNLPRDRQQIKNFAEAGAWV